MQCFEHFQVVASYLKKVGVIQALISAPHFEYGNSFLKYAGTEGNPEITASCCCWPDLPYTKSKTHSNIGDTWLIPLNSIAGGCCLQAKLYTNPTHGSHKVHCHNSCEDEFLKHGPSPSIAYLLRTIIWKPKKKWKDHAGSSIPWCLTQLACKVELHVRHHLHQCLWNFYHTSICLISLQPAFLTLPSCQFAICLSTDNRPVL